MRLWINRRPLQNHNMLSKDGIVIGRDNENDEMMMGMMMRWWINRKPQHVIKRCHCQQPCKPPSAKMAENAKIAWKRTNCKQSNSNRRCTDLHKEPWALFIPIIIIRINIDILSWLLRQSLRPGLDCRNYLSNIHFSSNTQSSQSTSWL